MPAIRVMNPEGVSRILFIQYVQTSSEIARKILPDLYYYSQIKMAKGHKKIV